MMSPWTSNFWGIDPTTHAESVYDTLHGYMGQSPFIPGLARGPGSWEARSRSVGRGSGCAQAADSGTSHIMSGAIPETSESMGELVHLRRLPLLDTALSACVPCLAMPSNAAHDLPVTGLPLYEPQVALLPGPGCVDISVCLL